MKSTQIIPSALVALTLFLAACGQSTQATPTAAPAAAATAAPAAEAPTAAPAAEPTAAAEAPTAAAEPTAATSETAPTTDAAPTAAASSAGMRMFVIDSAKTEASYDVQEQFLNQNLPIRAVGKTNTISGTFQFTQDGQPTGQVTNMTVDLRTLTSDSDRRDNAIRSRWLESDKYPYATFVSTGVEGVPSSYTEGDEVTFTLNGDMTIRDVTKPVSFAVTGKLEGNTVTGTATTKLMMVDFGFEPPAIAGVLTVEDGVTVTVNFVANEQ